MKLRSHHQLLTQGLARCYSDINRSDLQTICLGQFLLSLNVFFVLILFLRQKTVKYIICVQLSVCSNSLLTAAFQLYKIWPL